jgi:hypothetical protein
MHTETGARWPYRCEGKLLGVFLQFGKQGVNNFDAWDPGKQAIRRSGCTRKRHYHQPQTHKTQKEPPTGQHTLHANVLFAVQGEREHGGQDAARAVFGFIVLCRHGKCGDPSQARGAKTILDGLECDRETAHRRG